MKHICFLIIFLQSLFSYSQMNAISEEDMKILCVINLIKYATWPDTVFKSDTDPFVVGYYKADKLKAESDKHYNAIKVHNRNIVTRTFNSIEEIENCHVLYIGQINYDELSDLVKKLDNTSTLTISNKNSFAKHGVMFNLFLKNRYMKFDINMASIRNSKLLMKPQVLKMAEKVYKNGIN